MSVTIPKSKQHLLRELFDIGGSVRPTTCGASKGGVPLVVVLGKLGVRHRVKFIEKQRVVHRHLFSMGVYDWDLLKRDDFRWRDCRFQFRPIPVRESKVRSCLLPKGFIRSFVSIGDGGHMELEQLLNL